MTPADDYEIGFTGARFGGAPRKRRKKKADETDVAEKRARSADEADTAALEIVPAAPLPVAPVPAPAPAPGAQPTVGHTGARFGGATRRRRDQHEEELLAPVPVRSEPLLLPPLPAPVEDTGGVEETGRSLAVRPYFYTKGRTRSRYELAIETLVSTPPAAFGRAELAEHLPIMELCREPVSIAEIGALLGMPLGVARVVVGDLAVTGGLEVHSTVAAEGPDLSLMERVLAGLRKL